MRYIYDGGGRYVCYIYDGGRYIYDMLDDGRWYIFHIYKMLDAIHMTVGDVTYVICKMVDPIHMKVVDAICMKVVGAICMKVVDGICMIYTRVGAMYLIYTMVDGRYIYDI